MSPAANASSTVFVAMEFAQGSPISRHLFLKISLVLRRDHGLDGRTEHSAVVLSENTALVELNAAIQGRLAAHGDDEDGVGLLLLQSRFDVVRRHRQEKHAIGRRPYPKRSSCDWDGSTFVCTDAIFGFISTTSTPSSFKALMACAPE